MEKSAMASLILMHTPLIQATKISPNKIPTRVQGSKSKVALDSPAVSPPPATYGGSELPQIYVHRPGTPVRRNRSDAAMTREGEIRKVVDSIEWGVYGQL